MPNNVNQRCYEEENDDIDEFGWQMSADCCGSTDINDINYIKQSSHNYPGFCAKKILELWFFEMICESRGWSPLI